MKLLQELCFDCWHVGSVMGNCGLLEYVSPALSGTLLCLI